MSDEQLKILELTNQRIDLLYKMVTELTEAFLRKLETDKQLFEEIAKAIQSPKKGDQSNEKDPRLCPHGLRNALNCQWCSM